jgi:thiosulfate/3-mercaptopyruvate sulfurtransferase
MPTFVSTAWVQERLGSPRFVVLDPRTSMAYLRGHLKGSVSFPLRKLLLDPQGRLLPVEQITASLGSVGLGAGETPVIYDGYDGRSGAMLAWALEYLGRADVHLMDSFFEKWVAQKREIFYRPVKPTPKMFTAHINPKLRATLEEVSSESGMKLLDTRSRDEYTGKDAPSGRPGHIPGAVHVNWLDFLEGKDGHVLSHEKLNQLLKAAKIGRRDQVVAYCHSGIRAALGYVALKKLGYDVRLYDGSYSEWASKGMPVKEGPG